MSIFDDEDLVKNIEQHRDAIRQGRRFSFEHVFQQPLALAFALARAGRNDDASRVLDTWANTPPGLVPERVHANLRAVMSKACPFGWRQGRPLAE
jgi:hypothetical protein